MTIILLLVTFMVFIALDLILHRHEAKQAALEQAAETQAVGAFEIEPDRIAGFAAPADRSYHPAHGWVVRERKNVLRVGITDFAAKLLGQIDGLELPKAGQWVRQGQGALEVRRAGEEARLLSPVEGEVLEVNPEIAKDPSLLRRDPYGAGWLYTVYSPDEANTRRNLLPTKLVPAWMKDAAERLYGMQPELAGMVAADGGLPVDDLAAALTGHKWSDLAAEFLLTEQPRNRGIRS